MNHLAAFVLRLVAEAALNTRRNAPAFLSALDALTEAADAYEAA